MKESYKHHPKGRPLAAISPEAMGPLPEAPSEGLKKRQVTTQSENAGKNKCLCTTGDPVKDSACHHI